MSTSCAGICQLPALHKAALQRQVYEMFVGSDSLEDTNETRLGAKSGSRNQILRISCSDLFENFWNCLSNEIQNANELFSLVKRALTDMTWH